jgi:hypothetical protein
MLKHNLRVSRIDTQSESRIILNMGNDKNEYDLLEPFETDDLAGSDAERAFALGVEWALFREKLKSGKRFTDLIHRENADRLSRMAERQGRFKESHPHGDGWVEIVVGDYRD